MSLRDSERVMPRSHRAFAAKVKLLKIFRTLLKALWRSHSAKAAFESKFAFVSFRAFANAEITFAKVAYALYGFIYEVRDVRASAVRIMLLSKHFFSV